MNTSTKILLASTAGFYFYFNRNPTRQIEQGIISPSDGTIEKIENNRIDIFIGITDVHYQRSPITGTIIDIQNYPSENKNIITIFDNTTSTTINVERRGGILARSVITFVKIGDILQKGQLIGRILLGSHAAIYPIYNQTIQIGDHILSGQTIAI